MKAKKNFFLGVIPARGGSKGIFMKNIAPVRGHPLIFYSIEAAKASQELSDCIVSTDSSEIAEVAKKLGAAVPFLRPADLAQDRSASLGVLQHALRFYEEAHKCIVDAVVVLQPTAPLRSSLDIDSCIRQFKDSEEADSLISCVNADSIHPSTMYYREGDFLSPLLERSHGVRRQDFEEIYARNGAIYIATRDLLMQEGNVVGKKILLYEMPRERSFNVDEPLDLELVTWLLSRSENKHEV